MKDQIENPAISRTPLLTRRAMLGVLAAAAALPSLRVTAHSQTEGGGQTAQASSLPRHQHTATLLTNGNLLVAGGMYQGILADVQIFQVIDGIWRSAAPMLTPRAHHAAVLLSDGRVLALGGFYQGVLADAEIYDPATNTWSGAPPMQYPRFEHTATLVSHDQGDRILITGGFNQGALADTEIYTVPVIPST